MVCDGFCVTGEGGIVGRGGSAHGLRCVPNLPNLAPAPSLYQPAPITQPCKLPMLKQLPVCKKEKIKQKNRGFLIARTGKIMHNGI